MQRYTVSELSQHLVTYGRTFRDPQQDVLYFNWSCSTVEFIFSGTHLAISFQADCGYEFEGLPSDPNCPKRATWPWVAVFLDDMAMPIRKFEVASPRETWLVYHSAQPETHRIRLTKLTENSKSFLGISAFLSLFQIPVGVQQLASHRMQLAVIDVDLVRADLDDIAVFEDIVVLGVFQRG